MGEGHHVKFVPSLSQHPSCAHLVPCVITAGERLSRCESESWETPAGSLDDWCLRRFGGVCAAPVDRAPAPPATKYQLPLLTPPPPASLLIEPLPLPPTLPSSARFMRKTPLSCSHLAPLPGRAPGLVSGLIFYLGRPLTRTLPL